MFIKSGGLSKVENTGLLDVLIPAFSTSTGIEVDIIAVGTGKAITLGQNGDVDIIMVHAVKMISGEGH